MNYNKFGVDYSILIRFQKELILNNFVAKSLMEFNVICYMRNLMTHIDP